MITVLRDQSVKNKPITSLLKRCPSSVGNTRPSCSSSQPISFEGSEMKRLNLESLLNPQQNDIEFMEKEIQEYKTKVQQQNQEFKNLERQKAEIKSSALPVQTNDYDYLRQQAEMKQTEYERVRREKEELLNSLRMKQSNIGHVNVNAMPFPVNAQSTVIPVQRDDFFDRKEVIVESYQPAYQYQGSGFQSNLQPPSHNQVVYQQPIGYNNSYHGQNVQSVPVGNQVHQFFNSMPGQTHQVSQQQSFFRVN